MTRVKKNNAPGSRSRSRDATARVLRCCELREHLPVCYVSASVPSSLRERGSTPPSALQRSAFCLKEARSNGCAVRPLPLPLPLSLLLPLPLPPSPSLLALLPFAPTAAALLLSESARAYAGAPCRGDIRAVQV